MSSAHPVRGFKIRCVIRASETKVSLMFQVLPTQGREVRFRARQAQARRLAALEVMVERPMPAHGVTLRDHLVPDEAGAVSLQHNPDQESFEYACSPRSIRSINRRGINDWGLRLYFGAGRIVLL